MRCDNIGNMESIRQVSCNAHQKHCKWDGEIEISLVGLDHVDLPSKPGEQLGIKPQAVLGLAPFVLQQPRQQLDRIECDISLGKFDSGNQIQRRRGIVTTDWKRKSA